MEYYTLDDNLRRQDLIQDYQSFIWTERYNSPGDFEIVTAATFANRSQLAVGTWITRAGSNYFARVDTLEDAEDSSGVRLLSAKGMFFEQILEDRAAIAALTDTTTTPNWTLTGTPRQIIQELFDAICVRCVLSQNDKLPYYTFGTLLPTGNISEPTDTITVSLQPQSLLSAISQLCQQYNYGFRLVKEGETGHVYFEIYLGNDLTTKQTLYPPVIFDPDLDNLAEITVLSSAAGYKNVAYVIAANGFQVVYSPDVNPTVAGGDRRVLLVSSSNSDPAGQTLNVSLQAEGQLALAAARKVYAFDGKLTPNIGYIYGRDYNLGDLIEERNSDNFGSRMIVTEQIFASDQNGEMAYPTLTLLDSITPGSWGAYHPVTQAWQDVPTSVAWQDE